MVKQPSSEKPPAKRKRKTLLGWFVTQEEPDDDYLPELKSQWSTMDSAERAKFLMGAIVGALLFIGALILVYWLLSMMIG
ncbi:MAG: hypothetical protein K0B06_01870 [Brevefilum sp.]|nr:hypothetical protein [Brevefilum sp.]